MSTFTISQNPGIVDNMEITQTLLTPVHLAEMLRLIDNGTISAKIAKTVFEEMFATVTNALTKSSRKKAWSRFPMRAKLRQSLVR